MANEGNQFLDDVRKTFEHANAPTKSIVSTAADDQRE